MAQVEQDREVTPYVTNDMSFAAYLIAIHQFQLMDAKRLGRAYTFTLLNKDGLNINMLKYQYMGSEVARYDGAVRDLKRILFSDRK